MNLHHINVKGPRQILEKEKAFFCNILGLREGYRPNFSSQGYWLYFNDNPIVHLSESEHHIQTAEQGHFDHVAFQSEGLHTFVQHLSDKDIEHMSVYLKEIDMSQVFLKSPSGIKIEVNFENERIESTF